MSKKRPQKQGEQIEEPFVFDGFEPANTTPVPDVFFDVLMPHLNEAQLKVMLYIIRRTLGFKKGSDAISLTQFRYGITTKSGKKLDSGCGLKNFTTISKALKSLEEMGCIESVKGKTSEGDQATTVYRVRFRGTTPTVVPTTPNVEGVLRQTEDRTTSSGVRVLRQTESQERERQKTGKQQTEKQERKNAPSRASLFENDKQRRIDGYFLKCCPRIPSVNDDLKRYWDILAPRVVSQEDMASLYEYTQRKCANRTDPRVHPGNLVEWVEAWEQDRIAPDWTQSDESPEVTEEPRTDVPMYADRPLFYWTNETMEAAKLPKLRRQVIREKQAEWQQKAVALVGDC